MLVVVLAGIGSTGAQGQNNQFTQRSFLASPVALGMGDAGVALPGRERGFFYNPAHLPEISSHFTIIGAQGSATTSVGDHVQFLNDRLNPALEGTSDESVASLEQAATQRVSRPSRGHAGIVLPSFVYSPGAFGIGGGLFAKTAVNYRMERSDDGPALWALSRTDVMGVVSMGGNLGSIGLEGLSVGLTATQTRRFLAFKNKPIRQFEKKEYAVALEGSVFQLDGGFTYRVNALVSMPGTLRVGGAVYDGLEQEWDFTAGGAGRLPFLNDVVDESSNADHIDPEEEQQARRRLALDRSYRVGIAYEIPRFFFLEDVGMALDWQRYGEDAQAPLARVHLGARATVVGPLRLRAGVSAGYPSGGVGLVLGGFRVDYALYGVEEGRAFRQRRAYVHTARMMVRLR